MDPAVHDEPRFVPFTRRDRYGHHGLAPQPLTERVRLVLMSLLVAPVKIMLALLCLVLCHATCRLSDLLPKRLRNDVCATAGCILCTTAAYCLGLHVKWIKLPGSKPGVRAAGIVSNHCSWADILIHLGRSFPSFAAREGTQQLPLIGYISVKIQCVYVVRGQKNPLAKGVSTLVKAKMLAKSKSPDSQDRLMLLFPEGTTSNGRFLLPFKTGAFIAGLPLQPVLMVYDGKSPLSPCWDTINVFRHIWLLLCQPWHRIVCYELPVYDPSEEERADPVLYATNMRQYMLRYAEALGADIRPCDSTFETKLIYHGLVNKPRRVRGK